MTQLRVHLCQVVQVHALGDGTQGEGAADLHATAFLEEPRGAVLDGWEEGTGGGDDAGSFTLYRTVHSHGPSPLPELQSEHTSAMSQFRALASRVASRNLLGSCQLKRSRCYWAQWNFQ